jgi:iron-sulfur cluster repair protein YtfE (RIC family)
MKRAAELKGLSEDHHHGLVHARRLRRAASGEGGDPSEAARGFLKFWQTETSGHFRKEEEVLLPVYGRHGGDLGRDPVLQMHLQHARIRGLVMRLSDEVTSGGIPPETLREIGDRLEEHIRLEERELFPMIEESLSEEALGELGSRLAVREAGPRAEPWVPSEGLSYDPWPGPGDSEGGGWD